MIPIYHITHISNLASIAAAGGLWCDGERVRQSFGCIGIAHQNIKDRRARRAVPVAAKGTLADYVPFYFAPRSPMLYTISRGNVEGYQGSQEQIVHLVSSVESATALDRPWTFTEGHADMAFTKYFGDLEQLDQVDWAVMKEKYWNDTAERPDRKRRRQAEFLVHKSYPWAAVIEIGVMTVRMKQQCEHALVGVVHRPTVIVVPDWYY